MSYDDDSDLGRSSSERDLRGARFSPRFGRAGGNGAMVAGLIGLAAVLVVVLLVWRGYENAGRDTEVNTTGSTSNSAPAGSGAGSDQADRPLIRPSTPPATRSC